MFMTSYRERLGRIRVGDVVFKEEEEVSVSEIGSLLNGFEPVIADVRLSTETLLSTLRLLCSRLEMAYYLSALSLSMGISLWRGL